MNTTKLTSAVEEYHTDLCRSKIDQEGESKVLWISPETMDDLAAIRCPTDIEADPVFGLSGQQISRRIAAACEAAGLGKGYSGHSLRIGVALAVVAYAGPLYPKRRRRPVRYGESVRPGRLN